ncbi:GNAT family N-acetyltransferase [Oryzihumus sp.]
MDRQLSDVVPVLTDGVVTLRAHSPADLDAVVEQARDPEMVRWTTVPAPYERSDAQEFLAAVIAGWQDATGNRYWALEVDDAGMPRYAGTIDYRPHGGGTAEVGFGLHPWARGHGHMTRALRLVVEHAFEHGVHALHWRAAVGNWASRRTAWACGFRVEGTVRGLLPGRDGEPYDAWVASLRADDPREPATPWWSAPVLEGHGLRLRPWRDSDTPREGQGPDPASLNFMPAGAHPTAESYPAWLERTRLRSAEGVALYWCIADGGSDEALGDIQLFGFDDGAGSRDAEIGYWLHPGDRGRGVMAGAVSLVLDHAFAPVEAGGMGLERLHASTDPDNWPSDRVLRDAGFRLTGVETDSWRAPDGSIHGGHHFELLAADRGEPGLLVPTRLEGERVVLREWRDTDLPRLREALDDPARKQAMGLGPERVTEADARDWLARRRLEGLQGERVTWCLADREDDRVVGCVTVHGLAGVTFPNTGEVGYWVHPDERGRGLTNEALDVLVPHALTPREDGGLGLSRLRAHTEEANLASQTVLRRAGFMEWGREPGGLHLPDGSRAAVVHFGLGREDDRIAAAVLNEATAVEPVTLEGAGVRLRALRDEDLERVVEACSDPVARHWLSGLPEDYTLEHARDYLRRSRENAARGRGVYFAVADQGDDRLLGVVAVMDMAGEDTTAGEVGYWLHPDARGRGVMKEAVRLAVRHAFVPREDGGLGRRRLTLGAALGNDASMAIARDAGFVEVGRHRAAEPLRDGSFADLVWFDLLAQDYPG